MTPQSAGPWLAPAGTAIASVLLFIAPWFIPGLGVLWVIWTPLPLIMAYRLRGPIPGRLALGLALAGGLMLGQVFDAKVDGLYFLFHGAIVLVLGEAPYRRVGEPLALGLSAMAGVTAGAALLLWAGLSPGNESLEVWWAVWQQEMDTFMAASRQAGMDSESLRELRSALVQTGRLVWRLAPGTLCAGSLVLAWSNLLMARTLTRRLKPQEPPPEPLTRWQAPERLVWLLIAAGGVTWIAEGWLSWAGLNALLPLAVIYFLQGIAVMAYWLEKKKAPRMLRAGLYALVAVEVFLALLVALAGLFDLWFNFRRLNSKQSA
ncbi:DUF2232 domain-containing protein [Desulfarculales bacterium]